MFVEKWMTLNPVTLTPATTISSAAMQMGQHHFRHIPVAEPTSTGKKLVGMVSKYDIARAFPNTFNPFSVEVSSETVPTPVSSIMTRNVVTVTPDCAIEEAARILRTRRINALPVLRQSELIGIITESDIFDALLGITGATGGGSKLIVESDSVKNSISFLAQLSQQYHLEIQSFTSFPDNHSKGTVQSVLHFANRPATGFVQDLSKVGFRVLSIS